MNERLWKPGVGGAAGPASTSNERGLAPGKRTLVEGLNYGPPQRNVQGYNITELVGEIGEALARDPERELAGHGFRIWALDLSCLADREFWSDQGHQAPPTGA